MTSKKDILLIYFLLLIELLILINSDIVIKSVITSLNMFLTKIFPSLFPTMVMGLLLVKLGIYRIITFQNLFKRLFRFNEIDTSIFITSLFCGTPSNATFINNYLQKKYNLLWI